MAADPKLRRFDIDVRWPDGSPEKEARIDVLQGRWPEPGDLRLDDHGAISMWGYEASIIVFAPMQRNRKQARRSCRRKRSLLRAMHEFGFSSCFRKNTATANLKPQATRIRGMKDLAP